MKDFITKKPWDFWMFIFAIILVSMGIIMVFSASTPYAKSRFDNIYHFLTGQLFAAGIGFIAMVLLSFVNYKIYRKFHFLFLAIGLLLLVLVLVPGIGKVYSDARRWIVLGPLEFQPSEIYKLCIIIFMAASLSNVKDKPLTFFKGFCPYILLMVASAVLLLLQPHMSATVIILLLSLIMLYIGGARIWHFLTVGIPGALILSYIAIYTDYMSVRIRSFLDPFKYALDEGYQVVQSLYAIGSGGLLGRGLGRSMQKFLYIPEPQNDFIFAVLAEELGFVGVVVVISLFFLLVFRGVRTAIRCEDPFGRLLAIGVSSLIFIQAALNIAVVTGSVPPTGITLPLFSSGGTGLLVFMVAIGILLNVSRHTSKGKANT
ncbi:MAG: putative lipid II flippase FtsW [Clostridia bacterium]